MSKMKVKEIITVYEAMVTDGYKEWSLGYYRSQTKAVAKSNYNRVSPARYAALMEDGSVWLMRDTPVTLLDDKDELQRSALAKLTPEEKKALGL